MEYAVVAERTQWGDYRITLMVGEDTVSTRINYNTLVMVTGIVAQGLVRQMRSEYPHAEVPDLEIVKRDMMAAAEAERQRG